MLLLILALSLTLICNTCSAPATTYNQQQEGKWNVRADLENFVILVIPTATGNGGSLFDFLTKKLPHKHHSKHAVHTKPQKEVINNEAAEQFIESKTAPYHVDISRENIARLQPHSDSLLVKNSRIVELTTGQENPSTRPHHRKPIRVSKAFVITNPEEIELIKKELLLKHEHKKSVVIPKKGFTKKKQQQIKEDKAEEKYGDDLKLIGAENEQCGPGQRRDSYGICRTVPE